VSFYLDVVANVTLDFCGTNPSFKTCFIVMETDCPCGEYVMCNTYNQWECGDNNFKMTWFDLPPGEYYYPVMAKRGIAAGPYTVNISATGYADISIDPGEITGTTTAGNLITTNLGIEDIGYAALEYTIYTDQDQIDRTATVSRGNKLDNPYFGTDAIAPKVGKSSNDGNQRHGQQGRRALFYPH